MRMNEILFEGPPPIDAYGGGGFRIGGMRHEGSVALLPHAMHPWEPTAHAEIALPAFARFIEAADSVDVLLVGMGEDLAPLPREIRTALEAAGMGVEIMATGAACRTYNVLLAEDRRVAAALIAV